VLCVANGHAQGVAVAALVAVAAIDAAAGVAVVVWIASCGAARQRHTGTVPGATVRSSSAGGTGARLSGSLGPSTGGSSLAGGGACGPRARAVDWAGSPIGYLTPGCKRRLDLRTIQLLIPCTRSTHKEATHYNYTQGPDEKGELHQEGVLSLGCVSWGEQEKIRNIFQSKI